ncbi:MAG: PAS domain S-box protein [Planctomycetota bacterium]
MLDHRTDTKANLIEDLTTLRQRIAQLEILEGERKAVQDALHFRIAFENLTTTISTRFIDLGPDEIDDGIHQALQQIAEFVGADRSYVFLLREDGKAADNTHEWCAEGIEPLRDHLQGLAIVDFAWVAQKLLDKEIVYVPRSMDLPDEAKSFRDLVLAQGVKSLVLVPMIYEKSVIGMLGFDAVRKETAWSDDSIALLRIVGQVFTNALQHKRTEQALRESEDKFRVLVHELPDGVCIHEKGRIIFSNESHWRMLGFKSEEEILGADGFEFIAPRDRELVRSRVQRRLLGGQVPERYEIRSRRRDGTEFDSDLVATKMTLGGRPVILVIMRDISERKHAEEHIRRTEREKAAILDSMSELVLYHDADMRIVQANRAAARSARMTPLQLAGERCYRVWHGRSEPCERCPVRAALQTGQIQEAETGSPQGRLWFVRAYPVRDAAGAVAGVVEVVLDISDRKRAETALAAEKERLRVTLQSIGDGVVTTDTAGNVILINRVAENLTGWGQEEAEGKSLADIFQVVNERTRKPCESPVKRVVKTRAVVELDHHTILLARDGAERRISITAAPIRDMDNQIIGVVLVFRDITEKRKMEDELLKASKLESVGILAGGIAHDFNNILTGIIGNLSLAKLEAAAGSRIAERLTEAEKAALRARDLTRRLLTFSRGGAPIKQTATIADLLKDSASFVLTGSRHRCEFDIAPDLWPIEVDEGQISQVINNIVINADQAMPEAGVINIRAENVTVGKAPVFPVRPGRYVRISIRDYGIGIPEEHLQKIFDPYFTTKQRGSGLGLATAYSIVKNHDGYITVESELGKGATFYLYLPASHKPAPDRHATEPKKIQPADGRILVADDEEVVREVAQQMLQRMGYNVVCVRDGAEAVDVYRKAKTEGRPFDAVIMDLTIPGGMGGKEAIEELRRFDPAVKAIVSSGYSNDPVMSDFRKHGFSGVVVKPFHIADLGRTLQSVRAKRAE